MRIRLQSVLLCLSLLVCCADAMGTTLEKLSIQRMVDLAQEIVRARCVSSSARWDHGEIWTFTTFAIVETWKGSASMEVTVRLLGGTMGPLTSNVSGAPRFRSGEEVILFLEPTKRGDLTVVSWEQGTFRIGLDRRSKAEVVTQDTAGFETFDPRTKLFEATGIHGLPLEDFRARVQAAVAESARREP
jgi:hypothetical protein